MSAPYILYGGGVTRSIAVQPLLEEAGLPYELRRVALRRHGRQDWPGHLPSSIDRERQSSALCGLLRHVRPALIRPTRGPSWTVRPSKAVGMDESLNLSHK